MYTKRALGIMGGVGPYAGLDLMRKIFDNTNAHTDQDHLPVLHFCYSNEIAGRPDFLDGVSPMNPGHVIGDIMVDLVKAGATVLGMPCNTAHSPTILDTALERLDMHARTTGQRVLFIHMINEVASHTHGMYPDLRKVGVLGTPAICRAGVYQRAFAAFGIESLYPQPVLHAQVQRAILDDVYGIKAVSNPVTAQAMCELEEAGKDLIRQGVAAIVLGCTEIPLAFTGTSLDGVPLIDATDILARAMVAAFAPEKLTISSE